MKLEKIKTSLRALLSGLVGLLKKAILSLLMVVQKVISLLFLNKVSIAIISVSAGFIVGARMHEVGFLDGKFGKTLRGSTVFLSGPCRVPSVNKTAALAEDEVKVTGLSDDRLIGVIRKTREIVECEAKNVAVDTLPLLANLLKSPIEVPELQPQTFDARRDPEWKKLSQKTLLMTGRCKSDSGVDMPAFSDEVVDITNVEPVKDNPDAFILMGIRKSDKLSMLCDNRYVKYSNYMEKEPEPVVPVKEEPPKSLLGETILVTGTCFPDLRLPKHKQKQRVAFYPLVNARVQLTEESLNEKTKRLEKFAGAALDAGVMLVCDSSRAAFTYKEYDPESMKLSPLKGSNTSSSAKQQIDEKKDNGSSEDLSSGIGKPGEEQ